MEMQLQTKVDPPEYHDMALSAHQFSVRSVSLQCDSTEKFEIDMQTELIDAKNEDQQVDVYDLGLAKRQGSQVRSQIGLKVKKSVGCGTEPKPKKVLSSYDWFYSDLNRRLLKEFYSKN